MRDAEEKAKSAEKKRMAALEDAKKRAEAKAKELELAEAKAKAEAEE